MQPYAQGMRFPYFLTGPWAGKWLAVVLGLSWVVMLVLLSIHIVRRRSDYYDRHPIMSRYAQVILRILDVFLFIWTVLLTVFAVTAFAPGNATWEIRLALISALLAILGILVVIREDLSLRLSSSHKKKPEVIRERIKRGKKKT